MRLDLLSKNDSVLLLGEGNFSFAVCLVKHRLPITITATCFESEITYKQQQENIEFLHLNMVPVFLGVDATKLTENPNLCGRYFSKIIFNFPHTGGKMKIHLNRELLKKIFESASHVIEEGGCIIISLCQGQGGTPFDQPQRRWDDSWQIVEMAAHGNFALIGVEPFDQNNFKEYQCIGYRSQDVKFNLKGALVHILAQKKPLYDCICDNTATERLKLVPLEENSVIYAPVIFSELYKNNPILNPDSPVSFLRNLLIKEIKKSMPNSELNILSDNDISVYVKCQTGIHCEVNLGKSQSKFFLRSDAVHVFSTVLQLIDNADLKNKIILFPGMYFIPILGKHFTKSAPVKFQFLILGESLLNEIFKFINNLTDIFKEKNVHCFKQHSQSEFNGENEFQLKSTVVIICENKEMANHIVASRLYLLEYKGKSIEAHVVNADEICEYFFKVFNWKELWAEKNKVLQEYNEKPILKQSLLCPLSYTFDITLKYFTEEGYCEKKFYETLWLAAGQLIEEVELINEYNSDKNWSSKCYRITYKSLDKPIFRDQIINVHSKIVGQMLAASLKVTIS